MESVLGGLPNIVVYHDDILVTCPTVKVHFTILEEVLCRWKEAGPERREVCFPCSVCGVSRTPEELQPVHVTAKAYRKHQRLGTEVIPGVAY